MSFKKLLIDYHELIKSKQTLLLLATCIFAYLMTVVPMEGRFDWLELILLSFSTFIAISGATILNMYIDRDIDAKMERTKNRPLPSGEMNPNFALINGIIFTVLGLALTIFLWNWITCMVIFVGFFVDFVIYSIWLKRKTKYSILFGGIAGGLPAVAGRVQAIGNIDLIAILLMFFIVTWIPVHILTLSLIPQNLEGYKNAGVPMWPVVSSEQQTMRVIAGSALVNAVIMGVTAILMQIHWIVGIIIGACCAIMIILVLMNLIKPTQKLTFTIFKFASAFMLLGFVLLYIGAVV
ncbi:MAG: protoheme IX farnesyltransferase [Candidatus Lokiarchaeota archaeon]|nr:protoheme IX farnesyltransferase [Candidatus Lokiarchaeota archaeon]